MNRFRRILIVGCGSIGERHLRCFARSESITVGICEVNSDVRHRIATKYGIENATSDLDAAVQHPWDTAVIATPAHTHITLAQKLVDADVPVLIEKPLAVTSDGIELLHEKMAKNHLAGGVAYVYRAHPALQEMRKAITSGKFGRPLQLVATVGQHFPVYRPSYRETYYARHDHGGGAIQDALSHVINAGEWVVGPVTRVNADAAHLRLEGVKAEDTVHVIARHGDVLASYSLNQHQASNEFILTVVFESGTARLELPQQGWKWMVEADRPWQERGGRIQERDELFERQAPAWLSVLAGDSEPLCTLEEGAQTLRVIHAVRISAEARGEPAEV